MPLLQHQQKWWARLGTGIVILQGYITNQKTCLYLMNKAKEEKRDNSTGETLKNMTWFKYMRGTWWNSQKCLEGKEFCIGFVLNYEIRGKKAKQQQQQKKKGGGGDISIDLD